MQNKKLKLFLNKLNFFIGNNPIIEKRKDYRNFIPEPYKSVLLISADFELAWAWRFTKSADNPQEKAIYKATLERQNIPGIISNCEEFNIPITWATLGHLFLESCENDSTVPHPDLPRLPWFENRFWKFERGDWFQGDPCTNYLKSPEWYCPDLIKQILDSPVKHEIGCHTFSHIDCRDAVCSEDVIRAELIECKRLAKQLKLNLRSFVHPGHTIGNLDVLAQEGFTNFRTNCRNVLGYPKKHINGLLEFEQTAEFIYRKEWSIDYHIYRYITIVKRAIEGKKVCVLWFHPSFDRIIVERILPEVFAYIDDNREEIWVTTHTEYVDWFKNASAKKT
jgi:hypothetical protein